MKSLVESKVDELDIKSKEEPQNLQHIILYSTLKLSLYFIDKNDFIKEDYFSLNAKKIYKAFYELLMDPSPKQAVKFFITFENLDFGADIIFLICQYLFEGLQFLDVDLFFKIIMEKQTYSLVDLFDFPINPDRNELLLNLSSFYKIKYNKKEVTRAEVVKLFQKKEDNFSKVNKNVNIEKINKQEDPKKNIINKNDSVLEINAKKENEISDELLENKINNEIIDNSSIKVSEKKYMYNKYEKFLHYLKNMQKFYGELKYDPPVLKYLIIKKGEININYLKYKRDKNYFIDHLYDNMENFLLKLSLNSIDFLEEKYGYYCNKINNKYIEGLYAIVELKLLEEKIISDSNFPKDDFNNPDENIARNAFKSRALSLEYYINNNFLLTDLKVKEKPRVIYFFNSIEKILNIEKSESDNVDEDEEHNNNNINNNNNIYINIDNENQESENKEFDIIEVDGVVLEKNKKSIDLNEKIFIQDKCYEFGVFEDKKKKTKLIDFFTRTNQKQTLYNFNIEPNTLCVIEIKNQFTPNEIYVENKKIHNQEKSFYSMLKGLFKSALVFKTIYEQKKYEFNKIKLILFYDAIHKYNYENDLQKVMNEVIDINDVQLISKIQFQCIYVKSSYLLGSVYSMTNDLEKLKKELENTKKELEKLRFKLDRYEQSNNKNSDSNGKEKNE